MVIPDGFWFAIGAFGTCATALVAWFQIGEIKRQQQGWETLRVCSSYDTDPVLDRSVCEIRKVDRSRNARPNYMPVKLELVTVMNYFESIAIGIEQGLYDEKIVREHLEDIMRATFEAYFADEVVSTTHISADSYTCAFALLERWNREEEPMFDLTAMLRTLGMSDTA